MHTRENESVLVLTVVGDFITDIFVDQHRRFVGPATRNVAHCVAATAHHQQRKTEIFDELDAFAAMTHTKRETSELKPCAKQEG